MSWRWWEKFGLYLEGANKRAAAAAAESDVERTIGEEEGIPLERRMAGIMAGVQSSKLT